MNSDKDDISRTDTASTGCVWDLTGTNTRSYSGSASTDYNQIALFGKTKIANDLNLGFALSPPADGKTNYSDDYSSSTHRTGNGMILGVGIGKEDSDMVFEGGVVIEQENKDSGDGDQRDLFILYEALFGGGAFLVGYTSTESDKLEDGSTKIARPISSSTIDLEGQVDVDNGIYASVSLTSLNATFGDYGNASYDLINRKVSKLESKTRSLALQMVFEQGILSPEDQRPHFWLFSSHTKVQDLCNVQDLKFAFIIS